MTYVGNIKKCEWFKTTFITDELFKCLIFACGSRSAGDKDVRTRILSKIEQNPDFTLQQVVEECYSWWTLSIIQIWYNSQYLRHHLWSTPLKYSSTVSLSSTQKKPLSTCWNYGGWHFAWKYLFKMQYCCKCNQERHKGGFCTPPVHKTTQKWPHNKHRQKTKTQSGSNIFPQFKV